MAITSRSVMAWGSNEYGQLGLGENAPEQCSRPTPIKALQDIMITQVGGSEAAGVGGCVCEAGAAGAHQGLAAVYVMWTRGRCTVLQERGC